jgi:hypothetical protein
MAKSKKKSTTGLLSEAAKKAGRAVGDTARKVTGKRARPGGKSPSGDLSEAAKKAGRAVSNTARKLVGMRPAQAKKSGAR